MPVPYCQDPSLLGKMWQKLRIYPICCWGISEFIKHLATKITLQLYTAEIHKVEYPLGFIKVY